jgi:hypothetical protein
MTRKIPAAKTNPQSSGMPNQIPGGKTNLKSSDARQLIPPVKTNSSSPHVGEQVPLDQLHPHPRNYRSHPEDQLLHLVESIKVNGVYKNVVATRDGTLLAGHGVVEAARLAGLTSVPVIRLDLDPESAAALKILVADNEISHLGEVDDRHLSELLREIGETTGLLATGVR